MPIVVVKSRDGSRSYLLEDGRPMFIGRARECDILLPSPAVSRRHAVILYKNGICGVKDLGSFNGTLLNEHLINEPRQISEADVVRISSFTIRLHLNAEEADVPDTPPPSPRPDAVSDDTVDLAMETAPQPAGPKSPRPDAQPYANSGLRLPRAMRVDDSVASLIDSIQPNPDRVRELVEESDHDRKDTVAIPGGRSSTPPEEETVELARGMDAPSGPSEAPSPPRPTPDDTAYFMEPPAAPPPPEPTVDEFAGEIEEITAEPALTRSEAEAVIPLMEPEVAPTLSLEEDEITNAALEKLIEDLPTYKRERLEGAPPVAEITPQSPTPPDASDETPEPKDRDAGRGSEHGEFNPETGEYDSVSSDTGSRTGVVNAGSLTPMADSPKAGRSPAGLESIVISRQLMTAIDARLSLFALLSDLAEERNLLRRQDGGLPADVTEELDRQDAELDGIPTAEEASHLIAALEAERSRTAEGERGLSPAMRVAEEMAVSQWMLIRDSNLDALPAVYKEAYRLAADEPLARELTREQIAHGRLLGGAVYLLALEILAESATTEGKRISTRIKRLSEEGTGAAAGVLSKLGRLGRMANNLKNRSEIREEAARLESEGRNYAHRAGLAMRESKFIQRTLHNEFRQVYMETARRFVPRGPEMPAAVRAFLRYGAIGFKPWWMSPETKEFILGDCGDNARPPGEREWDELNILYADEYLAAVSEMECSPSPDDRIAGLERNSQALKTDRAYRRIVNARTYNVLMERMLSDLDERMRLLDGEETELETRMKAMRAEGSPGKKDALFDLQTEHQAVAIRKSNLEKHVKRIEREVVSSIIESVQEAEGRFRKGELLMPDADFLIRREVEALFEHGRRAAGRGERFMPMVLRESFPFDGDAVNARDAVRTGLAGLEALDPGVFVNVVIPAKKKINRVEFRVTPTVIILPTAGQRCLCSMGREGMEGGHLVLPICFLKGGRREKLLTQMLADFRWETSRKAGGRDIMNSDTLAGVFMRLRWEWRNFPKAKREKGMIFNDTNDLGNWRRVYELYMSDAMSGGKGLFLRNPDCYNALIGKFIDLPHGVAMLRRSSVASE